LATLDFLTAVYLVFDVTGQKLVENIGLRDTLCEKNAFKNVRTVNQLGNLFLILYWWLFCFIEARRGKRLAKGGVKTA
jgi:hypothetical protein